MGAGPLQQCRVAAYSAYEVDGQFVCGGSCVEASDLSLLEAASSGNTDGVKAALVDGANLETAWRQPGNGLESHNSKFPMCDEPPVAMAETPDGHAISGGSTPLMCAVKEGHTETARFLLRIKANPNARDENQSMPIHFAALDGNFQLAQLLVQAGSDITAKDAVGRDAYECVPSSMKQNRAEYDAWMGLLGGEDNWDDHTA